MTSSIQRVIKTGLCIGCGGCAAKKISNGKLRMVMTGHGVYEPNLIAELLSEEEDERAMSVCPFNPKPSSGLLNEDVIARILFDEGSHHNENIGLYNRLYAGYSIVDREGSSSGGIASWILKKMLRDGIVDGVMCVVSDNFNGFKYSLVDTLEGLNGGSKTKYYPVTLNEIIDYIDATDGRFAITGVPCFIKTIRLRQLEDESFNNKIKFTVGIFCGGYKTKGFTEYLIQKSGGRGNNNYEIDYRKKSDVGMSSDYSFLIRSIDKDSSIKMSEVGDMWGTGLFKPEACDFCDDMTSELADISLGDAWIAPYNSDPKGTSIIVTRSQLASELIREGLAVNELVLDEITEDQVELSQKGNITHRRRGLAHRLSLSKESILKKRVGIRMSLNPLFALVQKQRLLVRRISLGYWAESKDYNKFDKVIRPHLKKLRWLTVLHHLTRKDDLLRIIRKVIRKLCRI